MRRHIACPEVHFGGAHVIARDEAVEDFGEKPPLLRAEPPHDAEIDGDDMAVLVDEQIALMHVGMKEAVAHRVREEGAQNDEAEPLEILPAAIRRSLSASGIPSIQSW